jgi:hypothetical protein
LCSYSRYVFYNGSEWSTEELELPEQATAITDNTKKRNQQQSRVLLGNTQEETQVTRACQV